MPTVTLDKPGAVLQGQGGLFVDKIVVKAPGCRISNLQIANGVGKGITLDGADECWIENVVVTGVGPDGTGSPRNDLLYATNSHRVVLKNSKFYNAGGCHLLARNCNAWVVTGCVFEKNESTTGQHSESMSLGGDAPNTNNWVIANNTFRDIQGTGCIVVCGQGFKIEGNIFVETVRHGNGSITGWSGNLFSNSEFTRNTFIDLVPGTAGALYGIRIPAGEYNKATHNVFIGNGNHARCDVRTSDQNVFKGTFGLKSTFGSNPIKLGV